MKESIDISLLYYCFSPMWYGMAVMMSLQEMYNVDFNLFTLSTYNGEIFFFSRSRYIMSIPPNHPLQPFTHLSIEMSTLPLHLNSVISTTSLMHKSSMDILFLFSRLFFLLSIQIDSSIYFYVFNKFKLLILYSSLLCYSIFLHVAFIV